jgi:hypothetical protein
MRIAGVDHAIFAALVADSCRGIPRLAAAKRQRH